MKFIAFQKSTTMCRTVEEINFPSFFFCAIKKRNKLLTREKNEHEREKLMNDFKLFQVSGEQMG
jgi:hypothetical protein